ncbi:MAG: integration host factor subunit alpha [Alphaproteobacteria bacterium]|nr:integration host factor subunit alpha [Alphaproteobacteria bacterium]NCB50056.1 integration host factor subunit alpha [Alphaproteobacteria bacterium]
MDKTLTRSQIAQAIYDKVGFSYVESASYVDEVIDEMIKALQEKEEVKITSFATFKVKSKNKRIGRNPKTKEEYLIAPRRVISFVPSQILKKKANSEK